MILAGDIGGTKTVLALYEKSGRELRQVREETFPSREHASFEEILKAFAPGERLQCACFGVAGPVLDGKVEATNLPWRLDEQSLARAIDAPHVKLLNDLEAAAFGMLFLQSDEFEVLQRGTREPLKGNIAVIAPGTGLGEAILYWDGQRHHPIASEGGHTEFGPRTDQEVELLKYLRAKFGGHVSYNERLVSGMGIGNIYVFLRDSGFAEEPPWLKEKVASGDPNAVITEVGLAGDHPLCVATLDLFCSILGAEAGNLVLTCLAVGGLFLGGGIPPKILPALRKEGFMNGFTDKGRFLDLMKSIEVRMALNPRAPLLGAAHYLVQS